MSAISDWLPPLLAALTFTSLGLCKVYGWRKGVIGGGGKPVLCRLNGRCPTWSNEFNMAFLVLLLSVGLLNSGLFVLVLLRS